MAAGPAWCYRPPVVTKRRRVSRPTSTPPAPPRRRSWPAWAAVSLFAVAFAALTTSGASDSSASWDEPIHLTAGYAAVRSGDFRVDPSHPPLIRMWAALPVLALDAASGDSRAIDTAGPQRWLNGAYLFAHDFMYVRNDADRLLAAARVMIALLGVLLGILVFCWAREWLGFVPAAA